MTGRVIIVTGANSGIGFEVSKYLAEGGNDVTLACKDPEKGEEAITKIKVLYPSALVEFLELDLSSTTSVRNFVKEFIKRKSKLNVLINNAAVRMDKRNLTPHITSEGFEYTMASNYFGHFLLTQLLLDYMAQSAVVLGESRIINVTCASHDPRSSWPYKDLEELNPGNLQLLKNNAFNGAQAYKNSKLCNLLFTYRLAEAVKNEHVGVVAVDPGYVPTTRLQRHHSCLHRFFTVCCLHKCLKCAHLTKTVKKAALQVVDLATSEKFEGVTGKFFKNGKPERSSLESYDIDLQKSLWKDSCKLLGIRGSMTTGNMFDDLSLK